MTATPSGPTTFLGWGGECASAGTNLNCFVLMDQDILDVTANFTNPLPIPGQCGESCNHTHCNIPTSGFCTPPSTIAAPGTPAVTASGWEWKCEGLRGGVDTTCQAERKCGWEEK
ncbi:MAG: hypothetical protein U9O20_02610 [Patescibacteria group bacterium]|nr:hypothetical protein [Patescibacteria group bacterium]